MKRFLKYLPLHFLFFLILGIGVQFYIEIWIFSLLVLMAVCVSLIALLFFLRNKIIITCVTGLLFFFIGVSSVYYQDARNFKNYYTHYTKDSVQVVLKITSVLKPSLYQDKYVAEVLQVESMRTRGFILLNIEKDSLQNTLQIDNQIIVKPIFNTILPPLNPNQFNYKNYLAKQGVYKQVFLASKQYLKTRNRRASLIGIAANFRNKVQTSLEKYDFQRDELAVISALLLGNRQGISKELLTDYADAGAIHILAVSGLHVGILLWILSFLLKPLERYQNGTYLKAFILVLLLWMFAFVAGLSASVVRAVTMFTFVAIGETLQRRKIISFSLITSMLVLLIAKPLFLFDVGFQLSYLAVFSIVWLQPKIYESYTPRYFLDKKIWLLISVSLAAQIGILPLSIYYFQQFPGLFILSNLVIIPFLGTLLTAGILVIILSLLDFLPAVLVDFYSFVISQMNAFISWVSRQEQFLFTGIYISFAMMLAVYSVLFFGILFILEKKAKRLCYVLFTIILVQSIAIKAIFNTNSKDAFIVFHKNKTSLIVQRSGSNLKVQSALDFKEVVATKVLKSYKTANGITAIHKVNFKSYLNFKGQDIIVVDSFGVYPTRKLKRPIVLLQYSPKLNLERLIKTIQPSIIVADGSNYKSFSTTWTAITRKAKIPYHYTGRQGAFILEE